jgi:hypothetical protein
LQRCDRYEGVPAAPLGGETIGPTSLHVGRKWTPTPLVLPLIGAGDAAEVHVAAVPLPAPARAGIRCQRAAQAQFAPPVDT